MAYGDDIIALGANHLWRLDGNSNDSIGTLNFTNSGGIFTGASICEDTTNSYVTNGTNDSALAATDASVQDVVVDFCYSIWFRTNNIQQPPCRIFGDGGQTVNNSFFLGFGNSIVCEADCDPLVIQVGSDTAIGVNRSYNLVLVLRDVGGGTSELEFYIDGVSQGTSQVSDVSSTSRGGFRIGGVTNTTSYTIGGAAFQLVSPVNGQYSMAASFVAANVPTDTEIRQELFEKGATPGTTISSGTQAAMQPQVDALSSTVRPNEALNIRVEAVTGDGDITLTADNITHNSLASAHIQYLGTGNLTWVNNNGSNASISSTPNGGTVTFVEAVPVLITAQDVSSLAAIDGARVLIRAAAGGPLPIGTVLYNDVTDVNGQITFNLNYSANQPITGRVRRGTTAPYYKTSPISGVVTNTGYTQVVLMIGDQ